MFTYHIEGQFRFMFICSFRPNKYISACWTRSDFLWAPANTFLFKFPYKTITIIVKKKRNFRFMFGKNHLRHWKDNKKLHKTPYYGYFDFQSFC